MIGQSGPHLVELAALGHLVQVDTGHSRPERAGHGTNLQRAHQLVPNLTCTTAPPPCSKPTADGVPGALLRAIRTAPVDRRSRDLQRDAVRNSGAEYFTQPDKFRT